MRRSIYKRHITLLFLLTFVFFFPLAAHGRQSQECRVWGFRYAPTVSGEVVKFLSQYYPKLGENDWPALTPEACAQAQRAEKIFRKLISAAGIEESSVRFVIVVAEDGVDAYYQLETVMVYEGFLRKFGDNEPVMAQELSHELGHFIQDKRLGRVLSYLYWNGYAKQLEAQADAIGLQIMKAAGYSDSAILEGKSLRWGGCQQLQSINENPNTTHPIAKDRWVNYWALLRNMENNESKPAMLSNSLGPYWSITAFDEEGRLSAFPSLDAIWRSPVSTLIAEEAIRRNSAGSADPDANDYIKSYISMATEAALKREWLNFRYMALKTCGLSSGPEIGAAKAAGISLKKRLEELAIQITKELLVPSAPLPKIPKN